MPAPDEHPYHPAPINTSEVDLDPDVLQLSTRLAGHAHEVWAAARFAQGWVYGPTRNDARREHPCLVPYDELPEAEKTLDREAALGTLKAMLALGYRLVPPRPSDATATTSDDAQLASLISLLQEGSQPELESYVPLWHGHVEEHWARHPELYRLLGVRLAEGGSPLLAHDVVLEGLKYRGRDVRLRQI